MAAFEMATAIVARSDGTSFDVVLDEAWTIGGDRPNGGYLFATLGRAAVAACATAGGRQVHPIGGGVVYTTSPSTGPAVVVTEVLRIGRSASQVRARLVQGERSCVDATFTLGTLSAGAAPWWGGAAPVVLPPEAECRRMPSMAPDGTPGPSLRDSIVVSFDPATLGFLDGRPDGTGELRAWFRFADDRPVDPLALLFVVDAMPPATFGLAMTGWVPTLDLTAYVRAIPAPGPLRTRFRVQMVQDGLADEVCEVWDSEDRLVAQSTQLAALRLPPSEAPAH